MNKLYHPRIAQTVTWSIVTSGVATGTSISETGGLLTVAADEAKTSIPGGSCLPVRFFQRNYIWSLVRLPIAFATDDNYVPYLSVAIKSIIENAKSGDEYRLFILHETVSLENQKALLRQVSNHRSFHPPP